MRQPLDHTRHGILGAAVLSHHLVADIHNILPVLRCKVLVGGLGYETQMSVAGAEALSSSPSSGLTYRRHRRRRSAERGTLLL
jgi:hypothetical protein